jgi:hypothetical protein
MGSTHAVVAIHEVHGQTHVMCADCSRKHPGICGACRLSPDSPHEISLEELARLVKAKEITKVPTAATGAAAGSDPPLGPEYVLVNLNLFNVAYDEEYPADARWCMFRGSRPYYAPAGWKRVGVHVPGFEERFSAWPVAYHGTAYGNVLSLL